MLSHRLIFAAAIDSDRATWMTTDQISGEVDKVSVVLVDELHHGCLEQLVVELQVLSHLLQLHLLPTLGHKLVHVKVILHTETRQPCGQPCRQKHPVILNTISKHVASLMKLNLVLMLTSLTAAAAPVHASPKSPWTDPHLHKHVLVEAQRVRALRQIHCG